MAKEIDFESIEGMSEEQKQQVYYTLAKRANQRFRDITKTGNNSYAIKKAKKYLDETYGRETFKQSKKLIGVELEEGLSELKNFYTAKTSTVKGIKAVEREHIKSFEKKGIIINDKKQFFDFLSSQQFKTLSKYADSDQIVEDFTNASFEGFKVDDIMNGYQEFLDNDLTFEQVAERRNSGGAILQ